MNGSPIYSKGSLNFVGGIFLEKFSPPWQAYAALSMSFGLVVQTEFLILVNFTCRLEFLVPMSGLMHKQYMSSAAPSFRI